MAQLLGARDQQLRDHYFTADGTIASGNTAQLLLPERKSTSFLVVQNNSSAALWIEIGGARATATLTNDTVTSCTVTNGGFGYKLPPKVIFFGGGNGGNSLCSGVGLPTWPAPGDPGFAAPRGGSVTARPAKGHAVLTSGVVTSIVIDDPGSGYLAAPYVFLENDILDPFGVADPFFGSANSGIQLGSSGGSYYVNGTHCPTDAIAIWGATTGQAFSCRWAH